jgi:hypothetical protein
LLALDVFAKNEIKAAVNGAKVGHARCKRLFVLVLSGLTLLERSVGSTETRKGDAAAASKAMIGATAKQ